MHKPKKPVELPHLLVEAVKDKRVVLVFGAGASKEAVNEAGIRPPDGNQMRDKLAKKFLGTENETRDLMTVSEMAISGGAGEPQVFEEIARMVAGFPPSEAHRSISKFMWRGMATTNYDTLIEQGYAAASDRVQICVPFVKDTEPYDDRLEAERNPVALLKLHGCVNHRLDRDIPLVLSHEHYHRVRKNREKLLQRLQHWAESSVLIFIGYRLADNHIRDLIYDIDPGRRPQWYIVAPNADEHDVRFWAKKGVEIIKAEFGVFVQSLEQKIAPLFRTLAVFSETTGQPYRKHFRSKDSVSDIFLQSIENDFEYVHSGLAFEEMEPKKFYSGYDQGWCGIVREYDFGRKTGERLVYAAVEQQDKEGPYFLLLQGSAGAGKTIALKRAAYDASIALDQMVFWLKEGGVPRVEFFQELYDLTGKRVLLFIDQISLHEQHVLKLLRHATKSKLPITVIGAEREADWGSYCGELEEAFPPRVFSLHGLVESEAEDLVDLLERHSCLGLLRQKTKMERIESFLNKDRSDRQLLVALHELTQGKPFEEIILEEYQRIVPERAKRLYLDIATMHQFGVTARAGAISRISGVRFNDFEEDFFRPLKDIICVTTDRFTGDKGYETRHTRVARIVFGVACTSDEDKASQLARIISGLDAGFTADKRIIEKVCKGRSMAEQFASIVPAREIFDMACSVAPNSAFLFQQAAILEIRHNQGSLERAFEFAEMARKIDGNNHIYLHTLAEVKRRQANEAESKVKKEQLRAQSRAHLNEIWLKDSRKALSFCNLLVDETIDMLRGITSSSKEHEIVEFDAKVDDAVERLKRAMQDFPEEAEFSALEARLWQVLGDGEKAKLALDRAIRARPRNSGVYLRLSNIHRQADAREETFKVLKQGLDKFPDDKSLHLKMALHLVETQEAPSPEMEFHFRSSFAAGDHNFDGRFFYAEYLFWSGKIDECKDLFAEIDRLAPEQYRKVAPSSDDILTKKLGNYRGDIESVSERYFFIRFGVYPKSIFSYWKSLQNMQYDSLERGAQVGFKLRFNRKGPIGVDVQVI